jgi:tetratricopeptide (TPR) repeat protein
LLISLVLCSIEIAGQNINYNDIKEVKALLEKGQNLFDVKTDSAYFYWEKARKIIEYKLVKDRLYGSKISLVHLNLLAETFTEIGRYQRNRGLPKLALEYYYKSLSCLQVGKDTNCLAGTYNNIGVLYHSTPVNLVKAEESYKKAIDLLYSIDKDTATGLLYANLGVIYSNKRNYKKALEYLLKSVEINKKQSKPELLAYSYYWLGSIYINAGKLDSAEKYLEKNLFVVSNFNNNLTSTGNYALARLAIKKNQLPKAENFAKSALTLAENQNFPYLLLDAYSILSAIYSKTNNWKRAFEFQKKYHHLKDSVDKNNSINEIQRNQIAYEYNLKTLANKLKFENDQKKNELIISNQNEIINKNAQLRVIYLLLIILIIFIVFLIIRRIAYKRERKELELQLKIIETEQILKRALMNPHFLFNAMNSIQNLIVNNENKIARTYMVKLSKLMRLVLEQSEKQTITLREEIETIELYLEMEQLRFKNKFDFNIIVDEKINLEKSIIPVLIIQPIVENSIVHGIRRLKERKGFIEINFSINKSTLYCNVIDNGVGLFASQKYKNIEQNTSSFGIKTVSDRLKSLNVNNKTFEPIVLNEVKSEDGNVNGTLAIIQIPYSII